MSNFEAVGYHQRQMGGRGPARSMHSAYEDEEISACNSRYEHEELAMQAEGIGGARSYREN